MIPNKPIESTYHQTNTSSLHNQLIPISNSPLKLVTHDKIRQTNSTSELIGESYRLLYNKRYAEPLSRQPSPSKSGQICISGRNYETPHHLLHPSAAVGSTSHDVGNSSTHCQLPIRLTAYDRATQQSSTSRVIMAGPCEPPYSVRQGELLNDQPPPPYPSGRIHTSVENRNTNSPHNVRRATNYSIPYSYTQVTKNENEKSQLASTPENVVSNKKIKISYKGNEFYTNIHPLVSEESIDTEKKQKPAPYKKLDSCKAKSKEHKSGGFSMMPRTYRKKSFKVPTFDDSYILPTSSTSNGENEILQSLPISESFKGKEKSPYGESSSCYDSTYLPVHKINETEEQESTSSKKGGGNSLEKYLEKCLKNRIERSNFNLGLIPFLTEKKNPVETPALANIIAETPALVDIIAETPALVDSKTKLAPTPASLDIEQVSSMEDRADRSRISLPPRSKKLKLIQSSLYDEANIDITAIIEPIGIFMSSIEETMRKASVALPPSSRCNYNYYETIQQLREYIHERYSAGTSQMSNCLLGVVDDSLYSELAATGKPFLEPLLAHKGPANPMLMNNNLMKTISSRLIEKCRSCIDLSKFAFEKHKLPSTYTEKIEDIVTNEMVCSANNMVRSMATPDFVEKLLLRDCLGMVMSFNSCRKVNHVMELSLSNVRNFVHSLPETEELIAHVKRQKPCMPKSNQKASIYEHENRDDFLSQQWSIVDRIITTATNGIKSFVAPISRYNMELVWQYLLTEGMLASKKDGTIRRFVEKDKDAIMSTLREHFLEIAGKYVRRMVPQILQYEFVDPATNPLEESGTFTQQV
ncbi:hypothetical protein [Candidatus Ichthyocystis hellenicum]|uniref:hypothetical protein n=1 Tax=Candidatus Ichthyocystis hellenicum TaxID=1561003 RepID=UPI001111B0C6|nr:hypothetical protein [Candidatus Ichthyocystis hellenicum]